MFYHNQLHHFHHHLSYHNHSTLIYKGVTLAQITVHHPAQNQAIWIRTTQTNQLTQITTSQTNRVLPTITRQLITPIKGISRQTIIRDQIIQEVIKDQQRLLVGTTRHPHLRLQAEIIHRQRLWEINPSNRLIYPSHHNLLSRQHPWQPPQLPSKLDLLSSKHWDVWARKSSLMGKWQLMEPTGPRC